MTVTAAQIEGRSVTPPPAPKAAVEVQVTRKGHGKIATGIHDRTYGDELYAHNEKFTVAGDIAEVLEERGYVFIVEPEVAVVPEPKEVKVAAK
jgi:hypothetical protein